VSGTQLYSPGAKVTYYIFPNSGFIIESVNVDGVNVGTDAFYTFTNIAASHVLQVQFILMPTLYSNTWKVGKIQGIVAERSRELQVIGGSPSIPVVVATSTPEVCSITAAVVIADTTKYIGAQLYHELTWQSFFGGLSIGTCAYTVNSGSNYFSGTVQVVGQNELGLGNGASGGNYVGQTLRCRMYLKKPRLYINYCHDVLGFERSEKGDIIGIYLEDIDIPLAPSLVRKHFIYNFASTCHSLQGQSASNGITLFDVEGWYCTREWFYTALTRTTSLSEVYFWDVEAVGTVTGLPVVLRSDFKLALEAKLSGYRKQDENAGRTWEPSDFVDGEYIMGLYDEQDGKCAHCAESFPPRWKPDNNQQPTVDRIDNTFAHVKGNCVLACLQCNRARH
jgi:hypothetical protein